MSNEENVVKLVKKSAPDKNETLMLDRLKESILDWAAGLKSASPLPERPWRH
ncbi:hypothetical protein L383_00660 [Enterobacter sp. MGH 37]|jgi:hypothetical protein|nr:hypothetical protein L371_04669 [Enterobacter sp. MGH 25]EUM45095.1 hypothetical protein L383_01996 [Enterobacter sp. MGH 37]CAE7598891.1 hypothetical protein AI2762V1_1651 [Enterobacter cloacae]ESN18283.1 hypothetical protein L371_04229 [Enterobacter sp. MGH 25]ESN29136.1 hypothetical protein L371_00883 [Enterobacter sp. MGH 25]